MNEDIEADLAEQVTHFHEMLIANPSNTAPPADQFIECNEEFLRLTRCLTALEVMRRSDEQVDAEFLEGDGSTLCDSSLEQPQRIGRFAIQRRLGSGGQGYVFCAKDPELDRLVALKLPRPDILLSPGLRQRFLNEARFAARLRHPNLVTVYEVGEVGPLCYIASEYCKGCSLAEWLAKKKNSVDQRTACQLIIQLAAAVSAMHLSQIIHRDLKPSNVLLQTRSDQTIENAPLSVFDPKITDFGLARLFDSDEERTKTGALLGTPAYMSPEQARGEKEHIGQGTDIHALGVLLYELLTGSSPYQGKSDADTLRRILDHDLIPLRQNRPDIARDLEAICHRCLEPSPVTRYGTADELRLDLERFLKGLPTKARPLTPAQRLVRWSRRRPALASLTLVSISAAVLIAIGLVIFNIKLRHALDLASTNAAQAHAHHIDALRAKESASTHLYGTQMRLASLALEQGDHQRAKELLRPYLKGQSEASLSGFEVGLMNQLANRIANKGEMGTTRSIIHPDAVYSVDFSPDDQQIVTGCKDGVIRIWNVHTRQLVHQWKAHDSCINCIRYSPDGLFLASGGCDHKLSIWQNVSGSLPSLAWQVSPDSTPVRFLSFSPNSQFIASGGDSNWLRIWHVDSGEQSSPIDAACSVIERFDWSTDSKQIAIITRTNTGLKPVSIFDVKTTKGKMLDITGEHLSFSPDGDFLSILHRNVICHISLKSDVRSIASVRWPHMAHTIQWTNDGKYLASITNVNTLRLLDRSPAETNHVIAVDGLQKLEDMALSNDGLTVATASREGAVRLTTIPTLRHEVKCEIDLTPPISGIIPMACGIDKAHRQMLVCSENKIGTMPLSAEPQWSPIEIGHDLQNVRASSSGSHVTIIADQSVRLIDVKSKEARTLPKDLSRDVVGAYHFDGQHTLAVIDASSRVRVLDDQDFSIQYEAGFDKLTDPQYLLTYLSPDGRWFVYVNDWIILTCVDLSTGKSFSRRVHDFSDVAFLHHSDHLVVLSSESVEMCKLPEMNIVRTFRADNPNGNLAVSPDDKTLAISSIHGVLLTHLATGQEIIRLPMDEPHIKLIRFSDDGLTLTAAGFIGTRFIVHQWRSDEQ